MSGGGIEAVLVEAVHDANEWQYDDCDHGTYVGGPKNSERYAMCEIFAKPLAAAVIAWLDARLTEGDVLEAAWERVAEVRDASPRLPNDADTYDVVDAALSAVRGVLGGEGSC